MKGQGFFVTMCCQAASVMSDYWRPHRPQPSRLPCPQDSPGKNTGVGCHFRLKENFPIQGSNPHLLHFFHWQAGSLLIVLFGKPMFTKALPNSFSSLQKYFPSLGRWGLTHGSPQLQTLNYNSLLISNKLISAGKISGKLFILGQHFGGPYKGQRRPPTALGLMRRQRQCPQLIPLSLTAFLLILRFEDMSSSWI